jgi:hypothetical protein
MEKLITECEKNACLTAIFEEIKYESISLKGESAKCVNADKIQKKKIKDASLSIITCD